MGRRVPRFQHGGEQVAFHVVDADGYVPGPGQGAADGGPHQ